MHICTEHEKMVGQSATGTNFKATNTYTYHACKLDLLHEDIYISPTTEIQQICTYISVVIEGML